MSDSKILRRSEVAKRMWSQNYTVGEILAKTGGFYTEPYFLYRPEPMYIEYKDREYDPSDAYYRSYARPEAKKQPPPLIDWNKPRWVGQGLEMHRQVGYSRTGRRIYTVSSFLSGNGERWSKARILSWVPKPDSRSPVPATSLYCDTGWNKAIAACQRYEDHLNKEKA